MACDIHERSGKHLSGITRTRGFRFQEFAQRQELPAEWLHSPTRGALTWE